MAFKIPFSIAYLIFLLVPSVVNALLPYDYPSYPTRPGWDLLEPGPGRPARLALADWKETPTCHVIVLDVPGVRKGDVAVDVEEDTRVLRVSGERREEEGGEGEKWQRVERPRGRFWRRFRLPRNADVEGVAARLEDGVLRIVVRKVVEERRRQARNVEIVEERKSDVDGEIETSRVLL